MPDVPNLKRGAILLRTISEARSDQTLRDEIGGNPEFVKNIDRRQMKRGRARFFAERLRCLEDGNRNLTAGQLGDRYQPDRAGAGDEDLRLIYESQTARKSCKSSDNGTLL